MTMRDAVARAIWDNTAPCRLSRSCSRDRCQCSDQAADAALAALAITDEVIEAAAEASHEAYERIAPKLGYKTRTATRKPWTHLTTEQQYLMREATRAAIEAALKVWRE